MDAILDGLFGVMVFIALYATAKVASVHIDKYAEKHKRH
jgi:hypothetical protein